MSSNWSASPFGSPQAPVGSSQQAQQRAQALAYELYLANVRYAGFWRRAAGSIIDGIVMGLVMFGFGLAAFLILWIAPIDTVGEANAVVLLLMFLLFVGYLTAVWKILIRPMSQEGGTIGMRTVDIKIVSSRDHRMISTRRAFFRFCVQLAINMVLSTVVRFAAFKLVMARQTVIPSGEDAAGQWGMVFGVSLALTLVVYLWMLVDRRHRTLHDIFSGTEVVETI